MPSVPLCFAISLLSPKMRHLLNLFAPVCFPQIRCFVSVGTVNSVDPRYSSSSFYWIDRSQRATPFLSVQSLSHVWFFATPWTAAFQAFLSHHLPDLAETHVHRVGNAIQPSHLQSSPSPPAFSLPQHQGLFPSIRYQWAVDTNWIWKWLMIITVPLGIWGDKLINISSCSDKERQISYDSLICGI